LPRFFPLLSKSLDLLFAPLTGSLLLLALALLTHRRRPRLSVLATLGALSLLLVFSLEPVANSLTRSLETPTTRTFGDDVTYDAVLLLGGLVDPRPTEDFAEPTALNTHDNAVATSRIAREHGWTHLVVVTSAFHMPRALACFRAVGLEVDALPVDYRSFDPSRHGFSWLPRSHALDQSTNALRERAGRTVYALWGYAR